MVEEEENKKIVKSAEFSICFGRESCEVYCLNMYLRHVYFARKKVLFSEFTFGLIAVLEYTLGGVGCSRKSTYAVSQMVEVCENIPHNKSLWIIFSGEKSAHIFCPNSIKWWKKKRIRNR